MIGDFKGRDFWWVEDSAGYRLTVQAAWNLIRAQGIFDYLPECQFFHVADDAIAEFERIERERLKELPLMIFLDLNLPGMDGLSLLRNLKSARGRRAIPIIIVSSSAAEADFRQAYEFGAAGYYQKPIDFDDLVQALIDILNCYQNYVLPPLDTLWDFSEYRHR